ncbi:hypothetical protein [Microbacterium sp. A84]|uniref:hypothetical protein n=1 Tax=Microbacterium sp. A84 TaxID=3450715 RepID=UPI003F44327A
MIAADKRIRVLLADGSIKAEVAHRLEGTLAAAGSPDDWTPTTDARVRMAVAVALKAIHDELEARPGLTWEESVALDALLGQHWINEVIVYLHERRGADQ